MTPQFYVVGGAVRDVLLGKTPTDLDYVVVGATPEWMLENGYHCVGAEFPVFLKDGDEYALARTERKNGNGYHGFTCNASASVTLEEDLTRRDLTINSMAVKCEDWAAFCSFAAENVDEAATTFVIGPVDDFFQQILRANGDAFAEDPVRVLRAARFAAVLGWHIEHDTLDQMKRMVATDDFQKHLTKERVVQEVLKTAAQVTHHDRFLGFLFTLSYIGAMPVVYPDFNGQLVCSHARGSVTPGQAAVYLTLMSSSCDRTTSSVLEHLKQNRWPADAIDYARVAIDMFMLMTVGRYCNPAHENTCKFLDKTTLRYVSSVAHFLVDVGLMDEAEAVIMDRGVEIWTQVNLSSLTEEQQSTLKGRAVGDAIRAVRHKKLSNYFVV